MFHAYHLLSKISIGDKRYPVNFKIFDNYFKLKGHYRPGESLGTNWLIN